MDDVASNIPNSSAPNRIQSLMRLCESHAAWIEGENRRLQRATAARLRGEAPDIFEYELPRIHRAPLSVRDRGPHWIGLSVAWKRLLHRVHRFSA